MSTSDKKIISPIPKFYDTYLVPLIFEAYADDMARRVAALGPQKLLETAAGSGVVARALAPHLGANVQYIVTDSSQVMLDIAVDKQGADDRISWQKIDALDLPFENASFDVALCQFGVMFYPDRIKGYEEMHRVLKPGGRYIFNVWDIIETNELADVVTRAAATVLPDNPPRFLARIPHGYNDCDLITRELATAGFSDISITTLTEISRAPSPRHAAIAYCQGTPLRVEIESRDPDILDHVTDEAAKAIAGIYGSGPVEAKVQAHIVTVVR